MCGSVHSWATQPVRKSYLHSSVYLNIIKSKGAKRMSTLNCKRNGRDASFKITVVWFTHTLAITRLLLAPCTWIRHETKKCLKNCDYEASIYSRSNYFSPSSVSSFSAVCCYAWTRIEKEHMKFTNYCNWQTALLAHNVLPTCVVLTLEMGIIRHCCPC